MDNPQELEKAQTERTERAQSALAAGKFQVTRIAPQQWTVKNGDKLPYAVSLQGDCWTCTCPDYQQRGPNIRCKHIEGVRLSEAGQIPLTEQDKEIHMETSHSPSDGNTSDRIIWELRQPLDMSRVKRRQAPGAGSVPYLEGYDVIERANAIFGFGWSFDLIGEPVVVRWHKTVLAWSQQERRKLPLVDANGAVQTEEVGIVYITGKVTVEIAGKAFSHADLGRCIFTGDTPEALDMALAGSATDCLKRCFRQLGEQFGLSLYDKEIAQSAGLEPGHDGNPSGSTKPTAIVRTYGDGSKVNGNVPEQEAYDSFKSKTGKAPASKDELRNWLTTQKTAQASVAA